MSRFLGCGCTQRQQSELQPTVWAGRHNAWRRVPEMTDEFRGAAINLRKWVPYSPFSFGTSPGLFVPSNVFVKHQVLHLTAKSEGLPEGAPSGFAKWTTGAVVSQAASLYGYFECCFRASNTALASRFGLEGGSQEESSEILVFSYSAIDKHKELVYMDAKYAMKNADGEVETVTHPLKKVIFEMPETPVTVGIDWTPDHLKTYVDGHVIRHLENKHWHSPMHVSFKLETAPAEFGLPTAEKLGSRDDFEIYYDQEILPYPVVFCTDCENFRTCMHTILRVGMIANKRRLNGGDYVVRRVHLK